MHFGWSNDLRFGFTLIWNRVDFIEMQFDTCSMDWVTCRKYKAIHDKTNEELENTLHPHFFDMQCVDVWWTAYV